MATGNQQAFIPAIKFAWILYCAAGAAAKACRVNVTQPRSLDSDTASRNITIPCTFSTEKCPSSSPTILWFRYLAHTHEDLCVPMCTPSEKFQATSTVPEKWASLQINNANVGDNAIYFCGVAFADSPDPLSKQTGEGTTVTIRESKAYSARMYGMAAVLLLLFLYIAALFATFKVFSKPRAKKTESEGCNAGVKGNGQSISRAIAQELRKKKNKLNRRPQRCLEKETIYQNKRTLTVHMQGPSGTECASKHSAGV